MEKQRGGKRLKSLINNLRDLFGILFELIAFEALRNNIICLASISPVRLRKKEFILIGGHKIMKIIFWVSNKRLTVISNVNKIFFKSIV